MLIIAIGSIVIGIIWIILDKKLPSPFGRKSADNTLHQGITALIGGLILLALWALSKFGLF